MWCGNTKINHRNGQAQPCLVRSPRTGSNGFGHCRCAASREGYGPLVCSPALQKDPRAVCALPRCPSHRGEEGDGGLSGAGGKYCTYKSGIDPPTSQRLPSPPNRDMDAYHLPPFQAQQLWRNHFCRTGQLKEASETGPRRAEHY